MSNLYDELSQFIQENATEWALTEENPQMDLAYLLPSASGSSTNDNLPPPAAPHLYLPFNFYSSLADSDAGSGVSVNNSGPVRAGGEGGDTSYYSSNGYTNNTHQDQTQTSFENPSLAAASLAKNSKFSNGSSSEQLPSMSHHSQLPAEQETHRSTPYGMHPSQALQGLTNQHPYHQFQQFGTLPHSQQASSQHSYSQQHFFPSSSLPLPLDSHNSQFLSHPYNSSNGSTSNGENRNGGGMAGSSRLFADPSRVSGSQKRPSSGPLLESLSAGAKDLPPTKKFRHFTDDQVKDHLNTHKYLMFLPATREAKLYDSSGAETEMDISVSLAGNFFLSEPHPSDFDEKNPDVDLSQYDLTFYRRNLFHVTAIVSNAHTAVTAQSSNFTSRILSLSLAVSVTGNDKKPPKPLVYCPPRALVPDPKTAPQQGPAVKMIYPKRSGYDEVVNWKRLQFRTATAYNGRKKMRNYVSVVVQVYAELENAQRICLLTAQSHPIVVRGRNPRFYENRENITIPGGVIDRPFTEIKEESEKSEGIVDEDSANKDTQELFGSSTATKAYRAGRELENDGEADFDQDNEFDNDNDNDNDIDESKERTAELLLDEEDEDDLATPTSPLPIAAFPKREYDYEYFPMPLNYWLAPVEVVYRPHAAHHPMKPLPNQGKLPGQPKRALGQ